MGEDQISMDECEICGMIEQLAGYQMDGEGLALCRRCRVDLFFLEMGKRSMFHVAILKEAPSPMKRRHIPTLNPGTW